MKQLTGTSKAFKQKVTLTIASGEAVLKDSNNEVLDTVPYSEQEPIQPLLEYFNFIDFDDPK